MRIMGLDLGTRTIGVAVSDEMGLIARGIETIRRSGTKNDLARLHELVQKEEVGAFVLGYPKNMNGTIGERGKASEAFPNCANRIPRCKDYPLDERLSTVAAEKVLIDADLTRKKRKKVIDMMAAVVILQNYLDSLRR